VWELHAKELDKVALRNPALKIWHTTYGRSRAEHVILREGRLEPVQWSRSRFGKAKVDKAIARILAFDNVSYLSWGTRAVHLDGEKHDVPSILRKNPIRVIYDEYLTAFARRRPYNERRFTVCPGLLRMLK
jgi:hypothetical protein